MKKIKIYKYGISPIIKHPEGTYQVEYLDKRRILGYSKLLWFKDKKRRYLKSD